MFHASSPSNSHDEDPSFQGDMFIVYWFNVISMQDLVSGFLRDLKALQALTLVCKSISKDVRPFIQTHYWFVQQTKGIINRFFWYTPQQLKKVNILDETFLTQHPHIKKLSLDNEFTQPITISLPTSITFLTFGNQFDRPLSDVLLPQSLTHLIFGKMFNREIDNLLPPNLINLKLSKHFTQFIDHLPPKLTNLKVGWYFNNPIDHLPPKLTHLKFTHYSHFNHPIDNLPSKLTHLELNNSYKQPINKLPFNLIYLKLGYSFCHPIDNLPPNLTHLEFDFYSLFNHPINNFHLPKLTHLKLGSDFNLPIITLPSNIIYLEFGESFNQEISVNSLPFQITFLKFGRSFNKIINKSNLPPKLINLTLGKNFNHSINSVLPQTLQYLELGDCFTRNITDLPPNLIHLKLTDNYNGIIFNLPLTLENFIVGPRFDYYIQPLLIQQTLYKLSPSKNRAHVGLASIKKLFE